MKILITHVSQPRNVVPEIFNLENVTNTFLFYIILFVCFFVENVEMQ